MLRENTFKIVDFEQSPYAYRGGITEIKAHKDFENEMFTYSFIKGYRKSREIENFLWALKDLFDNKRDVSRYCNGKTFVRKTRTRRTYGIVIEGHSFKYNVRIDKDSERNGVRFYIVVNRKTAVAAA